mmetsp:Transcript_12647/g.18974  ORF Transcript_12647/g.18974 Transcript_12647/m.18974 type:complete len:514 (+) Transcript_12647:28-1569(+)
MIQRIVTKTVRQGQKVLIIKENKEINQRVNDKQIKNENYKRQTRVSQSFPHQHLGVYHFSTSFTRKQQQQEQQKKSKASLKKQKLNKGLTTKETFYTIQGKVFKKTIKGDCFYEIMTPSGPMWAPIAEIPFVKEKSIFQKLWNSYTGTNLGDTIERWHIRINLSENPVRSLYYSYSWRNRYFKIFILIYKLLLVAASILLYQFPVYAISTMALIHGLFFFILIFLRPYIFFGENLLHLAGTVLCVLNCAYGILALFVPLPDGTSWPMIIINAFFFLFVIINQVVAAILRVKFTWKYKQLFNLTHRTQKNISNIVIGDSIAENHSSINFSLTKTNLRSLMIFLITLGILCSMCIFISMAGILYEEVIPDSIVSVRPASKSLYGITGINDTSHIAIDPSLCKKHHYMQFAGYDSWESFTSNCCCETSTFYNDRLFQFSPFFGNYSKVELWKCKNGNQKERVRSGAFINGEQGDGLSIRPFCSTSFSNPSASHGSCGELLPSGLSNVSSTELMYLW